MIENYMTVEEAAEYLGYHVDSLYNLFTKGKFPGAIKFGKVWAIPEESVKGYKKGLQGFAAVKARKEAAR